MDTKNFDLGHGWWLNWHQGADETMTFRNADKGLRIDLPTESVRTLRGILRAAEATRTHAA